MVEAAEGIPLPQFDNFSLPDIFCRHAGLFHQLAPSRVRQGFPQFHRTAGKSPASLLRFIFPLNENNLVTSERDRENGDFRTGGRLIRTASRG